MREIKCKECGKVLGFIEGHLIVDNFYCKIHKPMQIPTDFLKKMEKDYE